MTDSCIGFNADGIPVARMSVKPPREQKKFCYVNSKSARKKLVAALFAVPRQALDLLPMYARLVAILDKVSSIYIYHRAGIEKIALLLLLCTAAAVHCTMMPRTPLVCRGVSFIRLRGGGVPEARSALFMT